MKFKMPAPTLRAEADPLGRGVRVTIDPAPPIKVYHEEYVRSGPAKIIGTIEPFVFDRAELLVAMRLEAKAEHSRAHMRFVMSVPIDDASRKRLRDVVRRTGTALAKAAHKYLSMASEYNERATYARRRDEKPQTHAQYMAANLRSLVTHQSAVRPESGFPEAHQHDGDLAKYIAQFEARNKLIPTTNTAAWGNRRAA